jgi:uncharacterized membrane protein YidH (DUF202 family)
MFRLYRPLRCSAASSSSSTAATSGSATPSFFSKIYSYASSTKITRVKNSSSTARDHLANERTFLAFARTGLSFLGVALALWTSYSFKYDPKDPLSVHPQEVVPAVGGLVFNGVSILVYALTRFLHVQRALETGEFIIAKRRFVLMMLMTGVVTTWVMYRVYFMEMCRKGAYYSTS